jgi:hypothetical protein
MGSDRAVLKAATADQTTNSFERDVVGNKEDAAVHASGTTKTIMAYIKGLVSFLGGLARGKGGAWFVDSAVSSSGSGKTWATAFKTIAEAVAAATAGDVIYITGTGFSEAVSCAKAGIRFIGVGTGPTQTTWTGATDAVCLTLTGTDCVVENIKFRPPVYDSGVPAAISMSGAHQTVIRGCRFQGRGGSWYAVLTDGNNANCIVEDCVFIYNNTLTYGTGIKGTGYTVGENSGWTVRRNYFHSNTNHIVCRMRQSFIHDNYFGGHGLMADNSNDETVLTLDLGSATTGGGNVVTRNTFSALYYHTATMVSAPDDDWCGNFCRDRSHTSQVDATTGISKAVPST